MTLLTLVFVEGFARSIAHPPCCSAAPCRPTDAAVAVVLNVAVVPDVAVFLCLAIVLDVAVVLLGAGARHHVEQPLMSLPSPTTYLHRYKKLSCVTQPLQNAVEL
jgi:hypothetical protein